MAGLPAGSGAYSKAGAEGITLADGPDETDLHCGPARSPTPGSGLRLSRGVVLPQGVEKASRAVARRNSKPL
jgi:hypothetical protein